MADLICVAFDQPDTADKVLHALTAMKKEQLIDLEDACVVVRPADGEPQIKQMMPLTKIGALSGGSSGALWGALVGLLFLNPLAGMAIGAGVGAATGALAGSLSDYGINDDFIKDLGSKIKPNSSALFLLIRARHRRQGARAAEGRRLHRSRPADQPDQRAGGRPAQGDRRRGGRAGLTRPPALEPAAPASTSSATSGGDGHMTSPGLAELRERALDCRNCHLWADATQTVFGEGPAGAAILFVGEQPGDQEDLQGRPFVGPAGQLFDRALAEAGIDRASVYVTNAVKHFKFEPRGKRRIHQKPDYKEVLACRPWLEGELERGPAPRLSWPSAPPPRRR